MDEADVSGLVQLAQEGDRGAFEQIYRRYHASVYRIARASLGEHADDAVAETFARAWQSLPRYKPAGVPFVAWLYGIARHVVVDTVRARKRDRARIDPPEPSVDPYAAADRKMVVLRALDKLPRNQREILEMKYLMEMTNEEVAAALGKSIGAVNAMQWRALRTLAEEMKDER